MLESAAGLTERPEARRRIEAAVDELDETIREIRNAIFYVEPNRQGRGLCQDVLDLSAQLAPDAEVSFRGPSGNGPDPAAARLRETLRQALTLISEYATANRIDIIMGASFHVLVIEAHSLSPAVAAGEPASWLSSLRIRAAQAGIRIDTPVASGSIRASSHLYGSPCTLGPSDLAGRIPERAKCPDGSCWQSANS